MNLGSESSDHSPSRATCTYMMFAGNSVNLEYAPIPHALNPKMKESMKESTKGRGKEGRNAEPHCEVDTRSRETWT
ncbi:hypothetical protein TWF718_008402 [Orbilia javanica]|uniref:Uncharacterized protein n=1 Tax=Orbilia javanica TaxID=47235 RepID=A0AAN8MSJ7_9PEZI